MVGIMEPFTGDMKPSFRTVLFPVFKSQEIQTCLLASLSSGQTFCLGSPMALGSGLSGPRRAESISRQPLTTKVLHQGQVGFQKRHNLGALIKLDDTLTYKGFDVRLESFLQSIQTGQMLLALVAQKILAHTQALVGGGEAV